MSRSAYDTLVALVNAIGEHPESEALTRSTLDSIAGNPMLQGFISQVAVAVGSPEPDPPKRPRKAGRRTKRGRLAAATGESSADAGVPAAPIAA